MGGFAEGLKALLGGAYAKRRIDDTGFDFREQDQQAEFERQRTQDVAGQQDEDRDIGLASEAIIGGADPNDPGFQEQAFGPGVDAARRAAILGPAAGGRGSQAKSSLQSQNLANRRYLALLGGDQDLERDSARAEDRQDLARLTEDLRRGRTLSPADQAKYEFLSTQGAENRASRERAAATARANRPPTRVNTTDAEGREITTFVSPEDAQAMARGDRPGLPRTSTAVATKREAARNSINLGTRLIGELEKDENVERIGAVFGRFNNFAEALGEGDPTAKAISGEIKSWSALQPAIHGFRSHQFTQDIEDVLNTSQNVETLIAGLKGVMAASFEVANQERPEGFDIFSGGPNIESLADSIVQGGGDPEDIQRLIDALEGQ